MNQVIIEDVISCSDNQIVLAVRVNETICLGDSVGQFVLSKIEAYGRDLQYAHEGLTCGITLKKVNPSI